MPGGLVKDATKVGSTIYAVGTRTIGTRTDGVYWTLDGITSPAVTALPDLCTFGTANCSQNLQAGEATTPDANYFASQARSSAGPTAVKVTRSPLGNLNLTPTPPFTSVTGNGAKITRTISDDGSILYGQVSIDVGGGIFRNRAVRIENGAVTQIFPQPPNTTPPPGPFTINQAVTSRAASSNGAVVVGSYFTSGPVVDNRAFRYVHGVGTTLIPLLDGGTYNIPIAITGDGNTVALVGDTSDSPLREFYTYSPSANPQVTRLGTPNAGMTAGTIGGITDDGSVVVVNSVAPTCTPPPGQTTCIPDRYIYFHNIHGWFHLTSALGGAGVDLSDWRNLQVLGINGAGTMIWGTGLHNDAPEGFVAEFALDYLKGFNPLATPPASTALTGVWNFDPENETGAPQHVVVFTADGAYYHIEQGDGFERGLYTFDGSTLGITTLVDTNSSAGLSDMNGLLQTNGLIVGDRLDDETGTIGIRFPGTAGTPVGGWMFGSPTLRDSSFVVVLLGADNGNRFFQATDDPEFGDDGYEVGTYTWDAVTGQLDITPFGGPTDVGNIATPAPDGLSLHVLGDDGDEFDFTRVVDPSTVPEITNSPFAAGTVGVEFEFEVTADNAATVNATGLPGGLSFDAATRRITGTPSIGGQFPVAVTAVNTHGISAFGTLTVTIAIPTPVGQDVVVEPEAPEGQGPITLSFDEVTAGGTTTVTVLDPASLPPAGNPNVMFAGVVFDVSTTATFEGLVNLCFSYEGIVADGEPAPRLFHFENNVWVDITTSVDTVTKTVCGATTSLSPFALLVSDVVRAGFHAPVNPIAGFLNTVKGGSTVPLSFNVFVNGTEKTTTDGLELSQQQIPCDGSAPEDPVEAAPSVGSGLTYRSGSFHYNWKTPKTPGLCYMVRMTTAQDGLALTGRFKMK
jgi:hypothetical protein